jgi:hypothetical protein
LSWFQKNFIDKPNIDIFCSINGKWDEYNDAFLKAFKVKQWHFEEYKLPYSETIFSHHKRPETNVYNLHSMLYNKKKCISLIQETQKVENVSYDYVMFFRADIIPIKDIYILPFSNEMSDSDNVYIPLGYDWGGYNDQIAHGRFDVMKKYSELYDKVVFYCLHEGCIFHPESLLKFHLERCRILVQRYDFGYKLNDKRNK